MKAFIQKSKVTQQNTGSKSLPNNSKYFGQFKQQNHGLILQRKNENSTSRLMLKNGTEEERLDKKILSPSEINPKVLYNSHPIFQAKLSISSPNDSQELEADRVADTIINSDLKTPVIGGVSPTTSVESFSNLQRAAGKKTEEGGSSMPEDEFVALKLNSPNPTSSPAISTSSLNSNPGAPLSQSARNYMEPRFGYNFSSVQIHTNPEAIQMASAINAAAFTHGQHIYFNRGRYNENDNSGRKLLAHELTHVVQQGGGDSQVARDKIRRSLLARPEIHANPSSNSIHKFWRTVEAHVNLHQPQHVRLYNSSGGSQDFLTSAGAYTNGLVRTTPYSILEKRTPPTIKIGQWGLQYYARFHGGVGFHSNICYPLPDRNRTVLTVDGTPHSHGCLRLHHNDSQTVYNALSVGSKVFIYNRAQFRKASWIP
jgi:hypothetical protein